MSAGGGQRASGVGTGLLRDIRYGDLVAMYHSPVGGAASREAIGCALSEAIETILQAATGREDVRDGARDLVHEAVFDVAHRRHERFRRDFEAACKRSVELSLRIVRRRSRQFVRFKPAAHDRPDLHSAPALVRGVMWRRCFERHRLQSVVLLLRLEGYSILEVAEKLGCRRALVNAVLTEIRRFGL